MDAATMNWVLSEPSSHKFGHAKQYPIIQWKWYIQDEASAGPEGISTFHNVAQMPFGPLSCSITFTFEVHTNILMES